MRPWIWATWTGRPGQEEWEWKSNYHDDANFNSSRLDDEGFEVYVLNKGKGKGQFHGDCYHCGKPGHSAKYCPTNPKGKGKHSKGKGGKGQHKGDYNGYNNKGWQDNNKGWHDGYKGWDQNNTKSGWGKGMNMFETDGHEYDALALEKTTIHAHHSVGKGPGERSIPRESIHGVSLLRRLPEDFLSGVVCAQNLQQVVPQSDAGRHIDSNSRQSGADAGKSSEKVLPQNFGECHFDKSGEQESGDWKVPVRYVRSLSQRGGSKNGLKIVMFTDHLAEETSDNDRAETCDNPSKFPRSPRPSEFDRLTNPDQDDGVNPTGIQRPKNPTKTTSPKETQIPTKTTSPKGTQRPTKTTRPKETQRPTKTTSPKEAQISTKTASPKET